MRNALVALLVACGGQVATTSFEQAETVCGKGPTVQGIDVSYYQGTIDWSAVKASGIDFAIIRVSDGTGFQDPKFQDYWDGSRSAGVLHGAYQFFRPAEDPIAQADLLLSTMGPMQADDLPPTLDVEVNGGLSSGEVAAAVQVWVDHVTAAIGRPPIIYTGKYFWDDNVGSDMSSSPLWHAQYTSASCPNISSTWSDWAMWQYDDAGSVGGISGGVDMDRWNGDMASLQAFLGPPGPAQPCGTIDVAGGIIDNGDACFSEGGPNAGMRHVTDAGMGGSLVWTHTTALSYEQNFAQWNLNFAAAGKYKVEVFTAAAYAQSTMANYLVQANGATTSFTIDQTAVDGWQTLGEIDFAAGGDQFIHLGDNTGEDEANNVQLVFDAVQLTPVDTGSDSGSDPSGDPDGDPGTTNPPGGCMAGGGAGWAIGLLVLRLRRRRAA